MNKEKRFYQKITGVAFLIYIAVMVILNVMIKDRSFSESENRRLEGAPRFSMHRLLKGSFTNDYENYIQDQFPFRDTFVSIQSQLQRVIGKKENNGVYFAKDGYLIQPFHVATKEKLQRKINSINDFVKNHKNVATYMMIVPNKVSILKEKLPKFALTDDQKYWMDQFKEGMDDTIHTVNIREALLDQKSDDIFYKTDHHWTTKGAYIGYKSLGSIMGVDVDSEDTFSIHKVSDTFYGSLYSKSGFRNIDPDSISLYIPKQSLNYKVEYVDEKRIENSCYHMENLKKKDQYAVFFGGNVPLIKIKSHANNHKRLLVIKDSYANSLIPFLIKHFEQIDIIDPRYYHESLDTLMKKDGLNNVLFLYNENTFLEDEDQGMIRVLSN